ncbi:MAG: LOG family protein [Ignavibacteriae bacterium]|nr:LOG family protein [Ignavibacteria bacterium]MBI3365062.1 LOG family protein [Ignavibacteriota bacterium]
MSAAPHIVSVFGSSRSRRGEEEYQRAYDVGRALGSAGFTICNGGYGGTMEAVACGAKEAGGRTIGVVCDFFSREANRFIDETIVMETLVDRLMKLVELGDAYVILKGSTGTLLELATVWEFINKKVIDEKPVVIVGNFWSPVTRTLTNELVHEGMEQATKYVSTVQTPEECVALLREKLSGDRAQSERNRLI